MFPPLAWLNRKNTLPLVRESSYPSVECKSAFLIRYWFDILSGLTQAASVMAEEMSRDSWSGAAAYCPLPLNRSAWPWIPGTQVASPVICALFPRVEASASADPLPSSIFQCPTSASAAAWVVKLHVSDHSLSPAAFVARTLQKYCVPVASPAAVAVSWVIVLCSNAKVVNSE